MEFTIGYIAGLITMAALIALRWLLNRDSLWWMGEDE